MKIADIYQAARDMASSGVEQALTTAWRGLFRTEFQRHTNEDDALAALRALGDDGTHLRQAVALAATGVDDETVEAFLNRYARGEETR